MTIYLIHNNESDRLDYIVPKLRDLASYLRTEGKEVGIEMVGSEIELIRANRADDGLINRMRRAEAMASVYTHYSIKSPHHSSRRILLWLRAFRSVLFKSQTLIRVEQELLYKHAHCWLKSMQTGMPGIVLESDAIFKENTNSALVEIIKILAVNDAPNARYYVDLAGGCEQREILNGWRFEQECESRPLPIEGGGAVTLQVLTQLTTNTACGYLISSGLASALFKALKAKRPLLGADWAMMSLAAHMTEIRDCVCIHTTPTIFCHGSTCGYYASTIKTKK